MGFCEEFTLWHFATRCSAVKFVKPWMSNHFSESRDPSYVGSAMCPEFPRKDLRGKSYRLHPKESGPEVDQGPGGVITSPTLLGPVLVWSQQNYLLCKWYVFVTKCAHDHPELHRVNKRFIILSQKWFVPGHQWNTKRRVYNMTSHGWDKNKFVWVIDKVRNSDKFWACSL